jgi:uncharacterized protein (TIGR02145 family)
MWESAGTKCDDTKLCVQYEGNGLTYGGSKTVNRVNYSSSASQQQMTKYSHTPNISDDDTQNGNYAKSLETNEVITIPGAQSVHVKLTYSTYYVGYDWVSFWAGKYPNNTANSNYSTGIQQCGNSTVTNGKFGNSTWSSSTVDKVTVECDVSGDTVTFGFHSASYTSSNYGYYAIITGTGTVFNRTVASGEYTTPTGTNAIFRGWSSIQTTAGAGLPSSAEYANESEVMSNIPGNNGDTKTLYAVWQQGYSITFNKDSNVSSIAVLDSDGNTIGTITSSGQSLTLAGGDTYTIKPTHTTGYTTYTITKTSGAGTIGNYTYKMGGAQFTVGTGAAAISVTSKVIQPMQNWTGCSSLAVGDTEQVYDTRDNEVYLVGKLADNKCWMLDNLRFDIVAHKDDISSANTNITNSATLTSLKTGNRNAGNNYATAGVSYWTSSYSYSAPLIAIKNASNDNWNPNTTTTSYGSGSGKIGVYYNYCAASAGSYCYGDGTSEGTSSGDAAEDICPAGWRMPTGGSSGEYQALYTAYSSNVTDFKNALSTPLSGSFRDGSARSQGSYGSFWSSTRISDRAVYLLYVDSYDSAKPQLYDYSFLGSSVRCLFK